jgi:hypothetical protein
VSGMYFIDKHFFSALSVIYCVNVSTKTPGSEATGFYVYCRNEAHITLAVVMLAYDDLQSSSESVFERLSTEKG